MARTPGHFDRLEPTKQGAHATPARMQGGWSAFEMRGRAVYGNASFLKTTLEAMTHFRHPTLADGPHIFSLIANCPPLDQNSRYCNLLQASHFSQTCASAWSDDTLLGFVSGYVLPSDPKTYFLWQIAVSAEARGQNLAQRLIDFVLHSDATQAVTQLQTTITADNQASQKVFQKLAQRYAATLERTLWLEQDAHFAGLHASEWLYTIGPLQRSNQTQPVRGGASV